MANQPPDTGTPRWVKVFGIVALALVLLVVVAMLVVGGEHGPGRHTGGVLGPNSNFVQQGAHRS